MGNLQIGLVLLMAIVQLTYGSVWPKDNITVVEDQPFVAYIVLPKSFGDVVNCSFKFGDDAFISVDTLPTTTSRGEWIYKGPANECGIRVEKLSSDSAGNWTLMAANSTEDIISEKVVVNVVTKKFDKNFDTFKTVTPGPTTISCSIKDNSYTGCRMSNEVGQQWDTCNAFVDIKKSIAYQCVRLDYNDKSQHIENMYFLIGNTNEETNKTIVETEDSLVLNCKFPDPLFECKVQLPNKSVITILPHRNNSDGYKTVVERSRCSIEIPKPFNNASDVGLWTIYATFQSLDNTGCMFYVGGEREEIIKTEVAKIDKMERITKYQDYSGYSYNRRHFEITCQAPVVVKQCYLKSPSWLDNDISFPDQISFDRTKNIGKCIFKKLQAQTGTWTCGILGEGYDEEIIQNIEVEVKSTKGEAVITNYNVHVGNTIELLCKSAMEQPISNCVFIDPSGMVHIPSTNVTNNKRITYFGTGLDRGQCGITIENLQSTDFGQWKCRFNIASNSNTLSEFNMYIWEQSIHLDDIGLNLAISMVGVSLFALVILLLIWYINRRCHNYGNVDNQQENPK